MGIDDIKKYIKQANFTLLSHRKAIAFAQKHKVWLGFWEYGWMSRALVIVAVLAGWKFLGVLIDWW